MVYLSDASLPGLSWKKAVKWMYCVVFIAKAFCTLCRIAVMILLVVFVENLIVGYQ